MLRNTLLLLISLATLQLASTQTVILDFEADETSTTFQYFGSTLDGSLTSVIANPNPTGINTSDNVTEFVKPGDAQTWAGAFSNPNPSIPVDVTTSNQVCLKVHFDHVGSVSLKLENATTGGSNWVTTQDVTTINEWTEICFDVNEPSIEDPFAPASGHIFQTVTLFFDFGTAGTGTDVIYYFDDLVVAAPAVDCSTVLDFESDETTTTFQYFGSTLDGSLTSVVANPNPTGINTSSMVTEFVKPEDAQTWAGAFSNPNPMIPVDVSNGGEVCIKVHFDHVGNVALKLENATTGGPNWVTTQDVTTINEWTEICFDVSEPSIEDPFTPATGHVYSTITLFFDFGIPGSESAATSYFDDIVVCSSGGASFVDVDFAVDMNNYTGDFTQVYISGSFNNWSGDANPLDDSDGDGVWEGTLTLATGLYEYKFTLDNWAAQEAFTGTEDCTITDASGQFVNRQLVVSSGGVDLPVYCWNSCYACGQSVMVTFNLGASHINVDSTGLYIAGGGNFGVPGDFPLRDDDGDNVWTITFEKPIGFSSYYTFTNGACANYSCKENIAGQDCANPGNFNDRFLASVMQDTVVATCFAQCTTDTECSGLAADGNVTFRVDMSEYTGDFTQVYVSGSFNGWAGDANPMDDSDGDNIWEVTIFVTAGQHEYKFTLDNWTAQEQFAGGEDCTITDPSGQFVNRVLDVDGDATLPAFCFNSCEECSTATGNLQVDHNLFTLTPTVAANTIWVDFRAEGKETIRILRVMDATGQVVYTARIDPLAERHTLDIAQLPAGVYLVNVQNGRTLATRKFIKQQ